jgi:hypothetical protein
MKKEETIIQGKKRRKDFSPKTRSIFPKKSREKRKKKEIHTKKKTKQKIFFFI